MLHFISKYTATKMRNPNKRFVDLVAVPFAVGQGFIPALIVVVVVAIFVVAASVVGATKQIFSLKKNSLADYLHKGPGCFITSTNSKNAPTIKYC